MVRFPRCSSGPAISHGEGGPENLQKEGMEVGKGEGSHRECRRTAGCQRGCGNASEHSAAGAPPSLCSLFSFFSFVWRTGRKKIGLPHYDRQHTGCCG